MDELDLGNKNHNNNNWYLRFLLCTYPHSQYIDNIHEKTLSYYFYKYFGSRKKCYNQEE